MQSLVSSALSGPSQYVLKTLKELEALDDMRHGYIDSAGFSERWGEGQFQTVCHFEDMAQQQVKNHRLKSSSIKSFFLVVQFYTFPSSGDNLGWSGSSGMLYC